MMGSAGGGAGAAGASTTTTTPFLVAVIVRRLTIDRGLVTNVEVLAGPEVARRGDHRGREVVQ